MSSYFLFLSFFYLSGFLMFLQFGSFAFSSFFLYFFVLFLFLFLLLCLFLHLFLCLSLLRCLSSFFPRSLSLCLTTICTWPVTSQCLCESAAPATKSACGTARGANRIPKGAFKHCQSAAPVTACHAILSSGRRSAAHVTRTAVAKSACVHANRPGSQPGLHPFRDRATRPGTLGSFAVFFCDAFVHLIFA